MTNTRITRMNAMPTSSAPHHFGQDLVSLTKAATAGNTDDIKNTNPATIAKFRCRVSPMAGWLTIGRRAKGLVRLMVAERRRAGEQRKANAHSEFYLTSPILRLKDTS